jgi:hypothetical protein
MPRVDAPACPGGPGRPASHRAAAQDTPCVGELAAAGAERAWKACQGGMLELRRVLHWQHDTAVRRNDRQDDKDCNQQHQNTQGCYRD